MQEQSRYGVGLDVGTTTVRCVVGHQDGGDTASPTIIGVGEFENSGMRKGSIVNIVNTAQAIDKVLEAAERMSGHQISAATVSINGSHIVGMSSRGVIAITSNHEVDEHDLARVEEAATVMQLPANREILQVSPRSYQLDGQLNIKDPLGMTGVRLEVDAHVITALTPHLRNLEKACEMTQTHVSRPVLSGLAAARIGLDDQLRENGVLLVDIGGSTTNLVVYEEGDLQHVGVLPMGSINITNDLAIGLKTDLNVAEEIKIKHATLGKRSNRHIDVLNASEKLRFDTAEIDMIVEARLEELFEIINKELKSIGRAAKLPGGVVICGGGANLAGIAGFAKEALQLPARIVKLNSLESVSDLAKNPSFAAAAGLMLLDLEAANRPDSANNSRSAAVGNVMQGAAKAISNLLHRFKS